MAVGGNEAGTRHAPWSGVIAASLLASLGHSGCLADRQILPADADSTPFMTTTIIEEPGLTAPLPGQVIILDPPGQRTETPHVHVTFARGDSQDLEVRWFINRPRPCTGANCLSAVHADLVPAPLDAQGKPVNYRDLDRSLPDFNAAGTCYRLDMYASPAFHVDDLQANEPLDRFDIVHGRWIYVVRGTDGTLPPISDCAGPTS